MPAENGGWQRSHPARWLGPLAGASPWGGRRETAVAEPQRQRLPLLVEWHEKNLWVHGWAELACEFGFWVGQQVGCSLPGWGWLGQKNLAVMFLVLGLANGDATT